MAIAFSIVRIGNSFNQESIKAIGIGIQGTVVETNVNQFSTTPIYKVIGNYGQVQALPHMHSKTAFREPRLSATKTTCQKHLKCLKLLLCLIREPLI